MESTFNQILTTNILIKWLPIIILIHILVGTITAIKNKSFKLEELVSYTKNGSLFFIFLMIIDFIYFGFIDADMGDFAVDIIQTLRGVTWIAVLFYYCKKIYDNLQSIGMPKLSMFENKIKEYESEG